jgi:predicted Zn-dependent protease
VKSQVSIYRIVITITVLMGLVLPRPLPAITVKEEKEMAKEFMQVVLPRLPMVRDPLIVGYVNAIGNKILAKIPEQPFQYHFYVPHDDVYNAFAFPAGHIFVNSGLFIALEHEDELAGIIAHEIAHVICRHISQKIERSKKINMATLAGMVAGVFLGAGGAATAASAVAVGSIAAGQSLSLAYSRENEIQADQLGLNYLTAAGYGGQGLLTSLKKIRSKQWFGSDEIPTYLLTHPASEERIAYISNWLEQHGHNPDEKPEPEEMFIRVRTRLLALYGEKSAALSELALKVQKAPADPIANWGYGLALTRDGRYGEAIDHLKKALEKRALDPFFLIDLGQIYYMDGRYNDALTTLEGAVGMAIEDPDGLFYLGRTRVELGKLPEAVEAYEDLIRRYPNYEAAYYYLGEAYGKMEKLPEAHFNLGLFYHRKRDYKNAAFHLKRALKDMQDSQKRNTIETLLEDPAYTKKPNGNAKQK